MTSIQNPLTSKQILQTGAIILHYLGQYLGFPTRVVHVVLEKKLHERVVTHQTQL